MWSMEHERKGLGRWIEGTVVWDDVMRVGDRDVCAIYLEVRCARYSVA